MNPNEFFALLNDLLSTLAKDGRTVLVNFRPGFVKGPTNGTVYVTFINLPSDRVKQRRGGGAEAENNRMLFSVNGFNSDPDLPVVKVQVEQSVNGIARGSVPRLRKKTAFPDKIAAYLAAYINEVAESHGPDFTHE